MAPLDRFSSFGHTSGRSLVDTFMHSAAWTAARRFVYSLPMPVIVVVALVAFALFAGRALSRRLRPRSRARRR